MQTYSVVFVTAELEHPEVYICEADDALHAVEQTEDANPECYVDFVFESVGPVLVGVSRTHAPEPTCENGIPSRSP